MPSVGRRATSASSRWLGNFSFGDYFKADAIRWAWEFSTESSASTVTGIWVTCHIDDDEAVGLWIDEIGFPEARNPAARQGQLLGDGRHGPVRSSSELFWTSAPRRVPTVGPANPEAEHRFVEFWNLVFQQYFRQPDGSLEPLRHRNIDTGAGSSACWPPPIDVPDVFATDEPARAGGHREGLTGVRLGDGDESDVALKLLADHARTMTFLVPTAWCHRTRSAAYVCAGSSVEPSDSATCSGWRRPSPPPWRPRRSRSWRWLSEAGGRRRRHR